MALPLGLSKAQEELIRQAVVELARWVAGQHVAAYVGASQRFSFFDRGAGNWRFGQVVARAVEHPDDFAIVAPAAAWAIHAIRAAEEALPR